MAGTSSVVTVGGSSYRGATSSTRGFAPSSPCRSRHSSETLDSSLAGIAPVRIVAPSGVTATPSTVAATRSRVAVAASVSVLPLTGDSAPPRTSCCSVSPRFRYSGSFTVATTVSISGRSIGTIFVRPRASPTASDMVVSSSWAGSVNA